MQKSEIISKNSYYALGLNAVSTQKDISRRAKEINARLKINDVPDYTGDVPFLPPERTANVIKDAIQELSQPKSRLRHHFFWFNTNDMALQRLTNKDFDSAFYLWVKTTNDKAEDFYNKKNVALLSTILLYDRADTSLIDNAVQAWKDLFDDRNLWKAFKEKYFIEDEVGCSSQIFKEFSKESIEILSDIFSELSKLHSNPSIYKAFTEVFSHKGEKVVSDVLVPIFETLNNVSEKLEKLNVSEDGVLDDDEKKTIAEYVSIVESELEKIEKLGLKEDGSVRVVRDRAADAIRTVVLDMHNELGESDHAEPILRQAQEIAGTGGEKQRIARDVRVIQSTQSHLKTHTKLDEFAKAKKYPEAILEIDRIINENPNDSDLKETLEVERKGYVLLHAFDLQDKGMAFFKQNNFPAASEVFREGYVFLEKHMYLFDLDEEVIRNEILATAQKTSERFTADNLAKFEKFRKSLQERFDPRQSQEGEFLIMIYDLLFYSGSSAKAISLKGQTTRNNSIENLRGWIGLLLWAILIYGLNRS